MINVTYFKLIAGDPAQWDTEFAQLIAEGRSLPDVQQDQHDKGRRSARLYQAKGGWTVASDSSLDNRAVLAGPMARKDALQAGIAWASEDPAHREFYALKGDLIGTDLV
jgi:hypothetical protein